MTRNPTTHLQMDIVYLHKSKASMSRRCLISAEQQQNSAWNESSTNTPAVKQAPIYQSNIKWTRQQQQLYLIFFK